MEKVAGEIEVATSGMGLGAASRYVRLNCIGTELSCTRLQVPHGEAWTDVQQYSSELR